jgi:serine/threonine protein kinase/tetratricopeptide (TPR) repeat protein
MIGKTISHYKILEKLGEGGMGVVYKAQDTRLDRLVALKFLPQHLTANEAEKARFLQEAKAASALNHPNVCTIYGIEEHEAPDGTSQQFIEMEYVDGVTLRQKIVGAIHESPLRINDALTYAIQVGEALAEAHSKGIVHRDIKCENIMVNSKNQVKVMDFGLAKLKGTLKLTRTSSTVGTLAYMSPEQIQGEEVDARSDIFSFGVVFYEMLTGHIPFRGEHEAAMMYSIVNEEPQPIEDYRPELSSEVSHIIKKALEKSPEDRYQSVGEMVVDLRRLKKESTKVSRVSLDHVTTKPGRKPEKQPAVFRKQSGFIIIAGVAVVVVAVAVLMLSRSFFLGRGSSTSERKMLVVLPFENLGPPDKDYFVDGITEEITSRLSGLSGLGVIARSSAVQYKKTTKSIKEIGQELGVSYILQGTVRWETVNGETHVRVNPQLIKVADGTQVWSQPSEAVLSSVFKLQSEIAGKVANALDVALLQPEKKSLEAIPTTNSEAYDYYLRGKEYYFRSNSEQDFRIAGQMFEHAIELDPQFALAYAMMSMVHSNMYWFFYDRTEERVLKSKEAAEKALSIDPELPEGHDAMGWYYYHGRLDYDDALKEFQEALKRQPNNPDILLGIAAVERRQGKMEDALVNFKKAVEMDPRSTTLNYEVGNTLSLLRRYDEALKSYDRALFLSPDWAALYSAEVLVYLRESGNTSQAEAVLKQAADRTVKEEFGEILFSNVMIDIFKGDFQHAIDRLVSSDRTLYQEQYNFIPKALLLAQIYGYMNRPKLMKANYDSARTILEREIRTHPEDSRMHSSLGIAYAGLGRKDDAIREGKRGVELMPISNEHLRGAYRVWDLARIYTMTGESEKALDLLEQLISMPSDFSIAWLRVDPTWAPLRNNPRFQRLIAENVGS